MRRGLAAGFLLLVFLTASAKPKPAKPQQPVSPAALTASPNVSVVRQADGWRADVFFDGPVLGWALRCGKGKDREIDFLVGARKPEPSDAPRCVTDDARPDDEPTARLFRWRPAQPDRLDAVASKLPQGALRAADLEGRGEDDLLLIHSGGIARLEIGPEGAPRRQDIVVDPGMGKEFPSLASWRGADADPALRLPMLGGFRTYRAGGGRAAALASEIALPQRVRPMADGFRLYSPAVSTIGRAGTGRVVFATESEPLGKQRLRTLLLDPDGPEETRSTESWALLPSPERVVDRAFAVLNGAPVLIVTTTSAEKLSLLGEKALRIYPLAGDRTRAGDAPLYATTTGLNLWQEANVTVADLDHDGHDDLVIAYWKGLKNAIAALEVYRGLPEGGFAKPRTQSFDIAEGNKAFLEFGPDLDADGRPDVILQAGKDLLVFPGEPPERALTRPVAEKPSRRIALPDNLTERFQGEVSVSLGGLDFSRSGNAWGTPAFPDLDGDGHADGVFADSVAGGTRIVLVFTSPSSSSGSSSNVGGASGR